MWGYGYGDMMGGYGLLGGICALLWIVLLIVIVVVLVRWASHGRHRHWMGDEKTALDILKERYAKGEINKQEFEEKKKDLS